MPINRVVSAALAPGFATTSGSRTIGGVTSTLTGGDLTAAWRSSWTGATDPCL